MVADTVIQVENLGKKYTIGHQTGGASYSTLRDTIVQTIGGMWSKTRDLLSGKPIIQGDELEEIWALNNLNFEIQRGEIIGVIGRNGAGKSTLLKILSRITEPSEGRVTIKGRVASLLEVGTGFHAELTGRENIWLNGAVLGMNRQEVKRKFDEIVAFAEVEKFLDTPVKRYSSGMYVRLAFAVAAHLEPEILLVDEVLAVGDTEFQKRCLGKMGEVAKQGRTVLLVSHNMPSIMNLCQRAILLDKGGVIADGSVNDVVHDYLSSARTMGGEIVWNDPEQAPGNDCVRLHAVRILQEGVSGSTANVDIAKETQIQISYWNLQNNQKLYAALWLRDQYGVPLFGSSNHTSVSLTPDPWYAKECPAGLYHSICRIPKNFLNDGSFSVTAIVGKSPTNTQIFEDQILVFDAVDTGEIGKEYSYGSIGTVRPKLAWNTALSKLD
ncbi:MAG: ABC transporter ATP-binding protein [Candidatus Hinthialibacter antarcticus]|nr:ABC transporter ATP-binding protein [Candidatus Hinthialibacter antarcticus]